MKRTTARPRDNVTASGAGETDESRETWEYRGDDQEPAKSGKVHRFTEALKQQFREVMKSLTHSEDKPEPPPRRRRTEETRGGFFLAARKILRRAHPVTSELQHPISHLPVVHLWDTLDWLNTWHGHDAITEDEYLHDHFENQQHDHLYPHL